MHASAGYPQRYETSVSISQSSHLTIRHKLNTSKFFCNLTESLLSGLTDLSSTNMIRHHLAGSSSDQQRKRINRYKKEEVMGRAACARWNPTPEQLFALEEIYRSGTRTPSAKQIQHIAEKLSWYGKIEGKNVFYWFQNHKARERQKRRRQLLNSPSLTKEQLSLEIESLKRNISGLSKKSSEVGHLRNRVTPSNSSILSQEASSISAAVVAESAAYQRSQFVGKEVQQTSSIKGLKPNSTDQEIGGAYQTLDLFPLGVDERNDNQIISIPENDSEEPTATKFNKFTPVQFFEFLPLMK